MTDYISREAAKEKIDFLLMPSVIGKTVINEIDALPAADVRENKRARWKVHYPLATCSECGNTMEIVIQLNYCPNCGADMREELNETL